MATLTKEETMCGNRQDKKAAANTVFMKKGADGSN